MIGASTLMWFAAFRVRVRDATVTRSSSGRGLAIVMSPASSKAPVVWTVTLPDSSSASKLLTRMTEGYEVGVPTRPTNEPPDCGPTELMVTLIAAYEVLSRFAANTSTKLRTAWRR